MQTSQTQQYRLSVGQMIAMCLRRVPIRDVRRCLKTAAEHCLDLNGQDLEAHWLAGGNIAELTAGLALAKRHGLELGKHRAMAIDLTLHGTETPSLSRYVEHCARNGINDLGSVIRKMRDGNFKRAY